MLLIQPSQQQTSSRAFLKEAVGTVNSGLSQTKNTISGVQGLSQHVSNKTGNADPRLDVAGVYSEKELFKELYGETPSSKIPQKVVALADQEKNNTTEDAAATDSKGEVAETENADASATDTEAVSNTTDTADAEETPNNSEGDTEGTDKVAAANDDGEDDEDSADIMDLLSNVATLGTIAGLIV